MTRSWMHWFFKKRAHKPHQGEREKGRRRRQQRTGEFAASTAEPIRPDHEGDA